MHRHELSGVLHGLLRVRAFTQDDSHVFCTVEQIQQEVTKKIENTIVQEIKAQTAEIDNNAKAISDKADTNLKSFLDKKNFVNSTFVQKYVNNLHPSLLMYSLNFHMRKHNIETIIADNKI